MPTTFSRTTRSLAQDSSKYAVIAWLIGGFFLTGWLVWFFFAEVTVYELSTKARLEVDRSSHPIAALVASKIVSTSLSLGQEVRQGEVLFTLDASSEKLRLQEEESKLIALPPQIAALEKQISELERAKTEGRQAALASVHSAKSRQKEAGAAVTFAKDNERRLKTLRGSGRIPVIETLRAQAESEKLSSNKEALTSDIQRLEMEAQTRAHQQQAEIENLKREVARLNGELATIQVTIVRLKQDIEKHLIRSPANGQIGDIVPLQVGMYIAVGEKLGTVVPRSELRIVADFPPASVLGRIHPGQRARMRLDGFPWVQFGTIPAKVSRVGSEIRDNQVRVEFTPDPSTFSRITLQHGLPGSIEVSIEQVSPAVMVLRVAGQLLSNTDQTSHPADAPNPK
ncbi:putative secretion protein [Methyloglobulus morosus KoM1]|uniref:Putative secretion protein n=1 Tax=Methyloglobulus morosus KoM1 TaxID=1116472 RepID=V5C5Y7_9GAMM|nr:HlyD family efflux transporter periplasmic adaptor subunit [Methyloglobulus morosus]ESS73877.1 putative secretion protein [Methyloglobulus morosus KoM1]